MVIVEFVNSAKKILNFIASESKFGFFKYDRFFKDVKVGDTIKVRFQGGSNEGMFQILTAEKYWDTNLRNEFMKEISGEVEIQIGKPFGFIDNVYIHPSIVAKYKLENGHHCNAVALKSFNNSKKEWGWKIIELQKSNVK